MLIVNIGLLSTEEFCRYMNKTNLSLIVYVQLWCTYTISVWFIVYVHDNMGDIVLIHVPAIRFQNCAPILWNAMGLARLPVSHAIMCSMQYYSKGHYCICNKVRRTVLHMQLCPPGHICICSCVRPLLIL